MYHILYANRCVRLRKLQQGFSKCSLGAKLYVNLTGWRSAVGKAEKVRSPHQVRQCHKSPSRSVPGLLSVSSQQIQVPQGHKLVRCPGSPARGDSRAGRVSTLPRAGNEAPGCGSAGLRDPRLPRWHWPRSPSWGRRGRAPASTLLSGSSRAPRVLPPAARFSGSPSTAIPFLPVAGAEAAPARLAAWHGAWKRL